MPITNSIKAPPVHRIIVAQLFIAIILAAGGLVFAGPVSAWSLLAGGLTSAVPNGYFVWKTFRYRGARAVHQVVGGFYTGEAVKLLLTCAGFGLVFVFMEPLNVMAFFFGFIAVHLSGIVVFVRIQTKNSTN